IGGRWYLKAGARPVYFYRDGQRFVDLFSYHMSDSNKDGIDEVRVSHDEKFLIVESQGFPNHPTANFPNSGNPNTIRVQSFRFRYPLEPKLSTEVTRVPMGPIGMALNGVVFFNPFEMGGMNAVEGYSEVWLDSCCGHPEQRGVYHYHKYPSCVKSPFKDDGLQHSPVIGFAFDGFPLYGPYESAKVMAKDLKGKSALDDCNGHSDPERGYHYHVTPGRFPYILGGYAGVVETSNNRGLARAGTGAIRNNASGVSHIGDGILSVKPATAKPGQSLTLRIELNPSGTRRGLPDGEPAWVQIGPFEAQKIARKGLVITAMVNIPEDAAVGVPYDCHIEFKTPNARHDITVLKANDVFRVQQ
ncbi:MAG: hypothetical protein JWN70_4765, partial [Planctomycetaceae bacterium]|nr:hypothetical protein [Planctomycetaceae bacterium]